MSKLKLSYFGLVIETSISNVLKCLLNKWIVVLEPDRVKTLSCWERWLKKTSHWDTKHFSSSGWTPAAVLLSKGVVKLPFLQAFKSVSPGRGWHAPIWVQKNPEANVVFCSRDMLESDDTFPRGNRGEGTGCPPSIVQGCWSTGSPGFFLFHHQPAEIMVAAPWRRFREKGREERE